MSDLPPCRSTTPESTAQDLARWIISLQHGDLLAKPDMNRLWTAGRLNDGKLGPWAIGWPVMQRSKHRVYMPTGGSKVAIDVYPDDDLAIVVLTNLSWEEPVQLVEGIAAFYVPDMRTKSSDQGEILH
jgi:CubicO group peptidase (beta-lactamase class C family)